MSDGLHEQAYRALRIGDWPGAQRIATALLQRSPGDADAYYAAGVAALRQQQLQPAFEHLRRATLLSPDWPEPLAELARCCLALGTVPMAIEAADRAMALSPRDGNTLDMLGVIYGQAHLQEQAKAAFEQAVERAPDKAASRFNLASSFVFAGELDKAEDQFEACLSRDPQFWRAHLLLAQVRHQSPASNHVARLRAALEAHAESPQARFYLNLALAKELEDLGDHDQAFACLTEGKAAGGAHRGYAIARDAAIFATVARCFPEAVEAPPGHDSQAPIFVIGMPRTGTTLVERILSSHPLVASAGELRDFPVALQRSIDAPGFLLDPAFEARVRSVDWKRVGQDYIDSTRHFAGRAPHFVDKLPHNFLYAGFIARAFPDARIVCLRRDPVDTCLSNFRQVFALDTPYFDYSYDLLDTGRYYLLFDALMAHWRKVIPGRILELDYEVLVDQPESTIRELLAFCDLPWNEACVRFEDNASPVATASSVQVRQSMNRRSIGRWKRYAGHLDGLLDVLAEGGAGPRARTLAQDDAVHGAGGHA